MSTASPPGAEQPAEVLKTELTLYFGATLAVTTSATGYQDWIRPGTSFSVSWKGEPTVDQLVLAARHNFEAVVSPLLDDIVALTQQRLIEARRGQH